MHFMPRRDANQTTVEGEKKRQLIECTFSLVAPHSEYSTSCKNVCTPYSYCINLTQVEIVGRGIKRFCYQLAQHPAREQPVKPITSATSIKCSAPG